MSALNSQLMKRVEAQDQAILVLESAYRDLSPGAATQSNTLVKPNVAEVDTGHIQVHVDEKTGRRYSYNMKTGESKWLKNKKDRKARR